MLNNGINDQMLARIRTAFDTQKGTKFVEGTDLPIARFDEWADADASSAIRAALGAEGRNNIVTPHFSDKMVLAGNPMGQLILQFRRFMFSNQMRVIGRNVQLASIDDAGSKRLGVYAGLFGLAFMGAVVDASKHALGTVTVTGGSTDPDLSALDRIIREWEKTPGTALYNALDRSSIFGVAFEASNMAEKIGLPNVRGGFSTVFGDDKGGRRESSRYANRGFFESVLGPTAGMFEDMVVLGSRFTGLISDEAEVFLGSAEHPHFSRSDFRRARRFVPGQNAPILQQVINEGERQVGTIFDWPAPR